MRKVKVGLVALRGDFQPKSANAERRTIDMIWKTSTPVLRSSLFDGDYLLDLPLDPKAVRMERLQSGTAPLLAAHESWSLNGVIGVIESASIDGKVGRATARFSERPEADAIFRDVQSGILRNVSVGARIHRAEEVKPSKRDELPMLRALLWEPIEISLVPVNGDAGAVVLADDARAAECLIVKGKTMRKRTKCPKCSERLPDTEDLTECPSCEADLEAAAAEQAELARAGRIHQLAEHFGHGDVWAQQHIRGGTSIADATMDGRRIVASRAPEIDGRIGVGNDYDSLGARLEGMADALSARGRRVEPSGPGRRYFNFSILDCAYELLRARGLHSTILDPRRAPGRVVELAMTTSDFPLLLANALNKSLLPAYMAATPTFRAIGRERQFRDYRAHSFLRAGDFPQMLVTGEGGEITEGAIGESGESVTALAYGRIASLTRRVLVDDDVGALADLTMAAGRRVADVQNSLFMNATFLAGAGLGPTMSDGVALHNAAHGNVGSAGALSNTTLAEARALMMVQRGLPSQAGAGDGVYLNVTPRYVLTSPASLTLAETFLSEIAPAQASNVNTFAGRLTALGDAHLSGTRFYTVADPAQLASYIFGSIGGEGPRVAVREGFEVEGVQVRISFDWAAGVVDWRGSTTHAGA